MHKVRTWIELDADAARRNVEAFRTMIGPDVELWAVVKSNAYGHGLTAFSKLIDRFGVDGFCVDSIIEGLRLRREGVTKPILVAGFTLPELFGRAAEKNIITTVSNFESLEALRRTAHKPAFHIKIDTGMHRQGFQKHEMPRLIGFLKKWRLRPEGFYSHLAFPEDKKASRAQERVFEDCVAAARRAGIRPGRIHLSATGGVCERRPLYDMVRVGFGLYGYSRRPLRGKSFRPVMAWKTIVSEVKRVKKGERIGYDFTERLKRDSVVGILPIGYWHGVDRGLSSIGEILVRGRRARILGRVSMDMTAVDLTGIAGVRPGDEVVIIGKQKKEFISADEVADRIGTTAYETLTRINPLIEKVIV